MNPELDELKRRYSHLPDLLADAVNMIASKITNSTITMVNIVYFPQLGFLVTVPLPTTGSKSMLSSSLERLHKETTPSPSPSPPPPLPSLENFQLQFKTEKVAYFKDEITRNLDSEIGDVYADIVDLELEIVKYMAEQLSPHSSTLQKYADQLAHVDCIQCLADFAFRNDLVRPELTDDTILEITEGRY